MNDKEAIRLLNDTFNSEFDLRKFTNFLNELFNGFYPQDKSIVTHKEYEQHIVSIKKIGNFRQKDKSMEILVIKLRKGTSLDKARTMQRNVVAKLLRNFNIDSALVAFISEDSPDWRFSFIKMDYKLAEDGKVSEELTPARRYSFLVGPNEPNHTCRKQFLELVKNEKQKPSIEEIESAFSIERVTKEFFERYKNLYFKLKENLDKLVEKDKNLREEFEDKEISTVDFSKKLLGQVVFLYFLQKKGWLGIKRGKERKFEQWGQGPKNFIKELFERAKQEKKNFFNDFLEPLFYEALAEDRRANDNYYSRFDCKIPFLNGGLFEPINDYSWGETDIDLDNSIFEEILGTFNEFNFTIKEDEPLEKEVAIDPEMLGKVFENLIEENIRKGQGAYYTPREIVHYMCQQSLINYLETNIKILRRDLEFFIQKGDLALDYLRRLEFGKLVNKNAVLPEIITKNAEELDKLLVEIKICDPAVGSGAFPVGMMNEIIKARTILSYILKKQKSDYEFKRETIENSLYGVDIEPSAVEITKLRFWLSLIVDEEDINNINPLPNLENKIMCGNSLLEEFEGIKLFDEKLLGVVEEDKSNKISRIEDEMANLYQELGKIHTGKQKDLNGRSKEIQKTIKKLQKQRNELAHGKKQTDRNMTLEEASEQKIKESQKKLKELRELQQKFFNEQNRSLKKKYAQQIDKIEWDLIEETLKEQENEEAIKKLQEYKKSRSKPFFLWKLYFADVFQRNNPGFDVVIANPPYVSYGLRGVGKLDTKDKDMIRRIFPNSAEYKISLYSLFMDKAIQICRQNGVQSFIVPDSFLLGRYYSKIRKLILNSNKLDSILLIRNKVFEAEVGFSVIYVFKKMENKDGLFFSGIVINSEDITSQNIKGLFYSQNYFLNIPYNRFRLFFDEEDKKIVEYIETNSERLDTYLRGHTGVRSLIGQQNIIHKKSINSFCRKGIISGSQVIEYKITYEGDWIEIDPEKLNKGGWDADTILKRKIFIRQTGDHITAALDCNKLYHLNNVHSFSPDIKEIELEKIVVLLNSKLMDFFYKKISLEEGRAMAQTDIETLEKLPIIVREVSLIKIHNLLEASRAINEDWFNYLYHELVDFIVYEIYLRNEIKTNLMNIINSSLIDVKSKPVKEKEKFIKKFIEHTKNSEIQKEIQKIKSHRWVKIIGNKQRDAT